MISGRRSASRPVYSLSSLLEIGSSVNEEQISFIGAANAIFRRVATMNHNRSLIGDLRPVTQRKGAGNGLLQTLRIMQESPFRECMHDSHVLDIPSCQVDAVWRILAICFLLPKCRDDILDGEVYFMGYDDRYQTQLCGTPSLQALHPIDFVIREWQYHIKITI